ncbi:MAG: hydroxymethylbilane synthase [Nitrospiraceae bacterium]|nr:hydroxymethylbilane synthase [Nitrospirota bacterium]MDA8149740.1 hydroxymethylbilane synthase [Nitrospiraceae bacterium]
MLKEFEVNPSPIRIGTRGSELALWQARHVAQLIEKSAEMPSELKIIKTTGDMILSVPLSQVGGKGLFVKEIEDALLEGSIDLAVHSMKDVPAFLPEGLILGAILSREDPRDAFVSVLHPSLESLPPGSRIGTSSLRRIAQLRHFRSDLEFVSLRGNVGTRLRKMEEGQVDAIILAAAGLIRLGYTDRIRQFLPTGLSLPAVGQGALGLEYREKDRRIGNILARIADRETTLCVQAERGVLAALNGGCQLPLAAHGRLLPDGLIEIVARVLDPEGTTLLEESITGEAIHAENLGKEAGKRLLDRGGKALLDAVIPH